MDPRFALLLSCFFLSGFAALLYQTVWSRELSFVFGTSDLAVAAVLAAYMGGLALGAAAAARLASRVRRPVLAYGLLELAIAGCALLVPAGIRGLNGLYVGLLGGMETLPDGVPAAATLLQLAGAFAVLLPPTAFMGATLPLLARHAVHRDDQIGSRVGVLYAVNTAGAIAGTLCAAFWLMPELGLTRTVWAGAGVNVVVFGLAALLARRAPLAEPEPAEATPARAASGAFWILPAIALSGSVSFTYEVLWTRLLSQLLGASLHAFATMLASFLLGITLGSAVAARLATTRARAARGFALSQLGIALTSWVAFALADTLPALSRSLGAGPASPLASAALAGATLLPITLCIGATFPFAVRVLAQHSEQATAATARVYAWNTVGAIFGALGAGFVLLPGLGFQGTLTVGVAASLVLAAASAFAETPRRLAPVWIAAAGALAIAWAPAKIPWTLLTTSPFRGTAAQGEIVHSAVGRTTTVVVTESEGRFHLTTDGLPEASIDRQGMLPEVNVAHWLSALPAWIREDARDLLVVGLGGGVALELAPRRYASIDVIELEPEVLRANRLLGDRRARNPLADPRVRVHLGDARGTLQLVGRRFDAVVSQPSHPWTAGASHLYTREFFSLVRSRLEPDGVFVQWIGIRFVDEELLRSLLAALVEVFPHVEVFRPQYHGLLFAASGEPLDFLAGAARSLRADPADFARFGIHRIEDMASAWTLDVDGVRALADGAPPNTDDHNFLATRSGQLGDDALDGEKMRALLDPLDPLPAAEGLDFVAVIRGLTQLLQPERAGDLARSLDGAEEEIGLGWIELAANRVARATRHFERALALAPGSRAAITGLIASGRVALARGDSAPGLSEASLEPRETALVAAWRHARRLDWSAVAGLDAELARFEPGDALFEATARLRVEQRLATGDRAAGAEAEAIARALVLRSRRPADDLLHARAALLAADPVLAWGSLQRVTSQATKRPVASTGRGRALAKQVLEVARDLPAERFEQLRAQLTGTKPGDLSPPAARARPAPPETP